MKAGDSCGNCRKGTFYYYGGTELDLRCCSCGWTAAAVKDYPLPSRETFWLHAEERGVTREQFDREWDEYQASRIPSA